MTTTFLMSINKKLSPKQYHNTPENSLIFYKPPRNEMIEGHHILNIELNAYGLEQMVIVEEPVVFLFS
jgi:hypothetical protein